MDFARRPNTSCTATPLGIVISVVLHTNTIHIRRINAFTILTINIIINHIMINNAWSSIS